MLSKTVKKALKLYFIPVLMLPTGIRLIIISLNEMTGTKIISVDFLLNAASILFLSFFTSVGFFLLVKGVKKHLKL